MILPLTSTSKPTGCALGIEHSGTNNKRTTHGNHVGCWIFFVCRTASRWTVISVQVLPFLCLQEKTEMVTEFQVAAVRLSCHPPNLNSSKWNLLLWRPSNYFSLSSILPLKTGKKKSRGPCLKPLFLPRTSIILYSYTKCTPFSRNKMFFLPRFSLFASNPLLVSRPLLSPAVPRLAMDAITRVNSATVFVQSTEHRQAQNVDTSTLLVVFSRAWRWMDLCTVVNGDEAWCCVRVDILAERCCWIFLSAGVWRHADSHRGIPVYTASS